MIHLPQDKKEQLVNYYVLQFFDMYLKGITSNCLAHCISVSKDSLLECGGYKVRLKKLSSVKILKGVHQHTGTPFLGSYFDEG